MRHPRPAMARTGELEFLRLIRRRAAAGPHLRLRLGIGDDCALLRPRPGEDIAVTTDLSIDGRHFRLDWHSPESIGHRTLARGLSDLAAMGARPLAAFLSLGLPPKLMMARRGRTTGKSWPDRFYDGLLALAASHNTPLAGGDLAESPVALADIVLVGAVPRGHALLRSGARAGDSIYVTGTLGGAAAGLQALSQLTPQKRARLKFARMLDACTQGSVPHPCDFFLSRGWDATKAGYTTPATASGDNRTALLATHLFPQPRLAQGLWLQRRRAATAAIDISDGLSTDLMHLCEESNLAAEIEAAAIPIAPGATLAQALHGGEDYELLFTSAAPLPRRIAGVPVTRIGRMLRRRAGKPQMALLSENGPQPLEPEGWQHFA